MTPAKSRKNAGTSFRHYGLIKPSKANQLKTKNKAQQKASKTSQISSNTKTLDNRETLIPFLL
jgi:hypothetical protein